MRTGGSLAIVAWLVAGWVLCAAPAAAADRVLCTIRDPRIAESSGLAASGDSLWTVNDGGSSLRAYRLDRSCRVRSVVTNDLDPYDVEDLALAADGTLWLADIGDNEASRSTVAVERLRPSGAATLLRLRYPDGAHDAEAVLLTPAGQLFVLTKAPLSSAVYTPAAPLAAGRTVPLRKVADLSVGPTGTPGGPVGAASQVLVTGGAVSPSGTLVAVRTYTDAYVWRAPGGDVEAALRTGTAGATRVPLPATAQGEAIAFAPDGRSLLTTTEGVPAPVHAIDLPADLLTPGTAAPAPTTAAPPRTAEPAEPTSRTTWLPWAAAATLAALVLAAALRLRRR